MLSTIVPKLVVVSIKKIEPIDIICIIQPENEIFTTILFWVDNINRWGCLNPVPSMGRVHLRFGVKYILEIWAKQLKGTWLDYVRYGVLPNEGWDLDLSNHSLIHGNKHALINLEGVCNSQVILMITKHIFNHINFFFEVISILPWCLAIHSNSSFKF